MEEASTEELDVPKGRRTKRFRPHSPLFATSSSSSSSSDKESTTTSEIDTARCLILLSRGYVASSPPPPAVAAVVPSSFSGARSGGVFTCKTCGRSFASFQALGGHRASHSKPKNEQRSTVMFSDEDDYFVPSTDHRNHSSLALRLNTAAAAAPPPPAKVASSSRVHECSYCSAEFTSGQALGGHMRKHRGNNDGGSGSRNGFIARPSPSSNRTMMSIEELQLLEMKKPRMGLTLDLNIPPSDDGINGNNN
ncbi:hypothetical protein M569_03799 [Genlisea aurea]|uniref:C2H2-type domain-containing protein n=1 Tax=Genlisea aurea TaxID=192259 RepID=S8E5A7_9LAMI|nr:hypothetical protein M569_03799 [Genlisea aurea]